MKCPSIPNFLGMAALSALSVCLVSAQVKPAPSPSPSPGPGGGAGSGNTGGGFPGTGNSRTPTNSIPGSGQQRQSPFPTFQRPIFLQGKVMLDDGNPPPEPILIERTCGGTARPEGYTDSKGRFSIELGRNSQMYADASTSSPSDMLSTGPNNNPGGGRMITERDLMACELRASLVGYRSDIVQLAGRRTLDNPEVGTIILHRLANVEGYTISATTQMAPKDAKKAYEKGLDQMKKNKLAEAKVSLEKAVEGYPKYAVAWNELGRIHEADNNMEEARKAYAAAIAADSRFVKPYVQLSGIAMREKKWQDAVDTTNTLIKLDPYDFPSAYYYNAIANLNLQNIDAAEKSARECVKLDAGHTIPKANHVLGVVLANKHDYAGAAASMKAYLALVPDGRDGEFVRKQLADVEQSLAAKASDPRPQP
ncbi:MAG: tetratricopeptide repeat protein [Bryobacteraceae bacterium]